MPNLDLDALTRRVVLDALDELARDRIGLYEILGAKVDDLHEHPDGPVWVTIHEYCLHLWGRLDGEPVLPDFTRGTGSI